MKTSLKDNSIKRIETVQPIDDSRLLNQVTEVLSVLSKSDALTLFLMARDGIKSELNTPAKIGLTKKQYYTRLKQLVDLGLVIKNEEVYAQTAFGKIIFEKHVIGLTDSIKNSKYFEMMDVLKSNKKFNDNEIMEFISKVNPEINVITQDQTKVVSVIGSYENMVRKALEIIEFAQKEILLISRFQNEIIINAILKKASSGITVKVIADSNLVEDYFTKEKISTKDKNHSERVNVVSNPFYPSKIERRYALVPYSLLIVDGMKVGLEITDITEPKKFHNSLYLEDRGSALNLIETFNELWKKASISQPKMIVKSRTQTVTTKEIDATQYR